MSPVGTVTYNTDAREWLIDCEPHVSLRLKRVFGKVNSKSQGTHHISDTPDNARDLEWFLQRYPMTVIEPIRLQQSANAHRERTALIQALLEGITPPQQFRLQLPPRDYQRLAATAFLQRGGLLLADDVGLGKTCSAITALSDPRTRPAVVVTLTHLPRQWKAELARFAPWLNVHIAKTASPNELHPQRPGQLSLLSAFPDVILINYHKLYGWAETLAKICKSVIYDECQELRKTDSAKYRAAHRTPRAPAQSAH